MKIASVSFNNELIYGIVDNDVIRVPDSTFLRQFPDLKSVIAAGGLNDLPDAVAQNDIRLADVSFAPVIPNPGKVLCVGINFKAHMKEMGRGEPDYPVLFVRFADNQVGHGQPLLHPGVTEQYDYEGEFAFVIGKAGHRISAADAYDYVAGYSCFMDGSVRDWQNHTSQFIPGKNFYQSGSFGPWLVTADDIPDPTVLNLETRLNGEVMQRGHIGDLKFGVPEIVEYVSTFCQLEPGDVISTGTPGGVGFARKPPVWLKPGDTVEVDIDGIGVLRNEVMAR
jgi:2-keto-4-pentenoate hydratase/2-oxohepta-3-ene-1,7-dioic acid hydratase in catechol pathway